MLTFEGCDEYAGVFPVPEALSGAAGHLPEGFQPLYFDQANQLVTYFITGYACTSPTAAGAADAGGDKVAENVVMLIVTPPKEFAKQGVDIYGAIVVVDTTSEAHASSYRSWGIFDGNKTEVMVEELQDTPVARVGHVLAKEKAFTAHQYSIGGGPEQALAAGQARVFGVHDKKVTGILDVNWTAATGRQGETTLRFEQDPGPDAEPPVYPGLAQQAASPTYNWVFQHVPLSALDATMAEAPTPAEEMRALEARFPGLSAWRATHAGLPGAGFPLALAGLAS
jgi:hypothetical protein